MTPIERLAAWLEQGRNSEKAAAKLEVLKAKGRA